MSFGGVASLFLGCSIVSIAEFVYYAIRYLLSTCVNLVTWNSAKVTITEWFKALLKREDEANMKNNKEPLYPYLP